MINIANQNTLLIVPVIMSSSTCMSFTKIDITVMRSNEGN